MKKLNFANFPQQIFLPQSFPEESIYASLYFFIYIIY